MSSIVSAGPEKRHGLAKKNHMIRFDLSLCPVFDFSLPDKMETSWKHVFQRRSRYNGSSTNFGASLAGSKFMRIQSKSIGASCGKIGLELVTIRRSLSTDRCSSQYVTSRSTHGDFADSTEASSRKYSETSNAD